MDRLYWFFLSFLIVKEFFKNTPVVLNLYTKGLQGLAQISPQLSLSGAKLILGAVLNLPLLIAIPAVYAIAFEMKTRRERIIGIAFLLLGWGYSVFLREWNDTFLFRVLLLIVASYGKDFRKIARLSIILITICLMITTALNLAGVIPEYDLERNGSVRHSFGLYSPVAYAGHISMILVTLIFLRNGILHPVDYIFIASLAAFNAVLIDGRASLLTTLLAAGGAAVYGIGKRKGWTISEKIAGPVRKVLAFSYVIVAGLFFLMTLTYKGERDAFYRHIPFLSTFEGRIEVTHRLLGELGLSLFGNYLPRYSAEETTILESGTYNFLDSSYSRMLLIYGIVGLALTLWVFTKVQYRLLEKKQTFRMYLLLVVAVNYVVERFLMDPMFNVFMLLFFAVLPEDAGGEAQQSSEGKGLVR